MEVVRKPYFIFVILFLFFSVASLTYDPNRVFVVSGWDSLLFSAISLFGWSALYASICFLAYHLSREKLYNTLWIWIQGISLLCWLVAVYLGSLGPPEISTFFGFRLDSEDIMSFYDRLQGLIAKATLTILILQILLPLNIVFGTLKNRKLATG